MHIDLVSPWGIMRINVNYTFLVLRGSSIINVNYSHWPGIILVGGSNPSEKDERQLGWLFPIDGKIKVMFQTANQLYVVSNVMYYMHNSSAPGWVQWQCVRFDASSVCEAFIEAHVTEILQGFATNFHDGIFQISLCIYNSQGGKLLTAGFLWYLQIHVYIYIYLYLCTYIHIYI